MNKIKQAYDTPTTDLLVVRFEQGILTGSNDALTNPLPSFTEDSEVDW